MMETPNPLPWKAYISVSERMQYEFQQADRPNIFHRFVQRLCFGMVWVKDKPDIQKKG